ncbi:MAG: bifunctional aspartate kinase/homoserine dehydrogenase I [Acidobacteria bacterium]|nr:bifunctional aspartate kinase/homoserine dehydrogenase I [Acidobacteriota bacterium]MBV9475497.1 bifunctional aspartate kinase/homoserine dehydrogenase I [Acidobacteriota bacterium]
MLEVYKFGGVAVGSPDAIRTAVAHVGRASGRVAVVVSAANGVTDLLLEAGAAALRRDADGYRNAAAKFEQRHVELLDALLPRGAAYDELHARIAASAHELRSMAESIAVLHELTPRAKDALVARGERMLAQLFTRVLASNGIDAAYVDAADIVLTERRLGSLWPDFPRCERAAKKLVLPLLESGRVVVMPGFLGSGPDGEVVTLGRGGTDFSAAILARSTHADSVTLFKEVDGLMTADPKSVPSARLLPELHYREAAELAFYGAKVLHPRTMIPLVDRKIPLYVRNTFREHAAGTRIADDVKPGAYPVKALTAIRNQSLIAIEGSGMIGVPGVAGRAFSALSQAGHSVSMISQASSESSICFVVPGSEAAHAIAALEETFALERKSKLIDRIRAEQEIALIAVVGLGMRGRPGIAARTFSALSGASVNVVAIAQGSSELNITIAVDERDATRALQALHNEYQLDRLHPLADTSGRESKLTLLGFGQIGRELAAQLIAQDKHLRQELGLDIQVIAVADRSGIKIEEKGFGAAALQRLAKQKATGASLFDRDSPLGLKQLQTMMREELWLLPSHRPILVDLTSDETAPLIQEALEHGFHVVLANKKPLAVPQIEFDRLIETAKTRGLALRYEATAGAGLPVLDTLAKLQDAGDRVESILGAFSGTLGFLMTALEEGKRFSDAVREAWKRGYTEPDPRDDLSGTDVARKALILARTLGRRLELSDIALESLYTPAVDDSDPARFVDKLAALDDAFAEKVARAKRDGKVLRYVAKIAKRSIRVGIEAVDQASPLGRLRGTDNTVVIHSKRYATNPLVVTGPGAGAGVTAAGVLNDIVAITLHERRKVPR